MIIRVETIWFLKISIIISLIVFIVFSLLLREVVENLTLIIGALIIFFVGLSGIFFKNQVAVEIDKDILRIPLNLQKGSVKSIKFEDIESAKIKRDIIDKFLNLASVELKTKNVDLGLKDFDYLFFYPFSPFNIQIISKKYFVKGLSYENSKKIVEVLNKHGK